MELSLFPSNGSCVFFRLFPQTILRGVYVPETKPHFILGPFVTFHKAEVNIKAL